MYDAELSPIGGYFELELPPIQGHYHDPSLRFNSGRSCFAYFLICKNVKKVYIPYFICDSLLEPLKFHHIKYEFYGIDKNFEIVAPPLLLPDERLLYANYFGLKSKYVASLIDDYSSSLIIDNTHSFFSPPDRRCSTFYSPRKFFGVPDGGYLVCSNFSDDDLSEMDYYSSDSPHLTGRIEHGAQEHYSDYVRSEKRFSYTGVKKMSRLSERILASIDYPNIMERRKSNLNFLHKALGAYNKLNIDEKLLTGPFCYPFSVKSEGLRKKLIESKIFVPTYWTEVITRMKNPNSVETGFVENIIPLPVDQRYSDLDMQRIIDLVQKEL